MFSPADSGGQADVCIVIALHGGIGVINSNFPTAADQATEVSKVKRYKHGFNMSPVCLGPHDLVSDIVKIKQKFGVTCVPITKNGKVGGKLLGSLNIVSKKFQMADKF